MPGWQQNCCIMYFPTGCFLCRLLLFQGSQTTTACNCGLGNIYIKGNFTSKGNNRQHHGFYFLTSCSWPQKVQFSAASCENTFSCIITVTKNLRRWKITFWCYLCTTGLWITLFSCTVALPIAFNGTITVMDGKVAKNSTDAALTFRDETPKLFLSKVLNT